MGAKDTKAKEFLSDNERFADLFNYYLFDGKSVINAQDLLEQDTTKVLSIFGTDKREIQKQKWRDLLKSAIIKTTAYGIFVHNNPMFTQLDNEAVSTINIFTGVQIPVEEKEGKEIINQLILCLIKDGRQEDIEKAVSDLVYQDNLIQYYGLDNKEEKIEV